MDLKMSLKILQKQSVDHNVWYVFSDIPWHRVWKIMQYFKKKTKKKKKKEVKNNILSLTIFSFLKQSFAWQKGPV